MGIIRGAQLVVEISEQDCVGTSTVESEAELNLYEEQLQALRNRFGIRVGLCEFGTGHSSMLRATTLKPDVIKLSGCLLYTSPSPRDGLLSRMPSSA